jgi:hypothetical protein
MPFVSKFFQVSVGTQPGDNQRNQIRRRAGMNQAEINTLHGVVLAEQHQILIGAPDGFFQIASGFLEVFRELVNLGVIQFQIVVVNGLPGEHLAGVFAQDVRRFWHAENDGAFERA